MKITKIQELLVDLQQENYDQLLAVVDLMREICANSHNNKMTSTNLAIIWGPIAFRGTNVLPGDILEVGKNTKFGFVTDVRYGVMIVHVHIAHTDLVVGLCKISSRVSADD